MAEPKTEIKEESINEFVEKITTDATDTEDATTIETGDATKYDTDYESIEPDVNKEREEKKKAWLERCMENEWSYEGPLWQVIKSYTEKRKDKERTLLSDVAKLPSRAVEEILPPYECFPLGGFQLQRRADRTPIGLDRCKGTRIWRSMMTRQSTKVFRRRGKIPRTGSGKWPSVWPCVVQDQLKTGEKKGRKKRRDVFPCDSPQDDDEEEFFLREQRSDFANRKELGHVRTRVQCVEPKLELLVDRTVGERPGLVDGDYVIVEFDVPKEQDRRVYANVVLRGLKGMHLPELSPLRERKNTWKFCFYQAVVALLARTQLRYKYAWSVNIDYIYDHAWTLYTHIGTINVKEKQRLDDVVVYNYKYDVEIELIQEMREIPVVRNVDFNYEESGLRRQITLRRKDPLEVRVELGCQKMTNLEYLPVHEETRKIEEWFDKLAARYRDCIFRTTRFSLAFWQDGLFWYLYNPYRCDEFGYWDDDGRACIVKFCSKNSLRRHLMILLLRAYAYREIPKSRDPDRPEIASDDVFDIQIFHVTFHCCQLLNLKLLQRGAPEPSRRRADERPSDSLLEIEDTTDREEDEEDDPREPREKVTWLKCRRVTWGRCAKRKSRSKIAVSGDKVARWHQYYVEEPNKLFSLWGEMHITDRMFDEANRGMQTYACYVVCAGMTRIMAPEYWSPKILDAIVVCGDRYYTRSKHEAELKSAKAEYAHVSCWRRYLCDRFEIGETLFEARMLPAICGRLYARSRECLRGTLERLFSDHHFGVLTCESACLGIFKFCGAYYMCDVNSFGPPLFPYGQGAAYLIRATSLGEFVTVLVLTIASSEPSRFSLNPVEILRIVEIGPAYDSRTKMSKRRKRFGKFIGKMRAFDERTKGRIKK